MGRRPVVRWDRPLSRVASGQVERAARQRRDPALGGQLVAVHHIADLVRGARLVSGAQLIPAGHCRSGRLTCARLPQARQRGTDVDPRPVQPNVHPRRQLVDCRPQLGLWVRAVRLAAVPDEQVEPTTPRIHGQQIDRPIP